MFSRLKRSTKRLLALIALLPAAVLVLGTIYMLGMEHLEGAPRTLMQSIQWASETITNTGYGADNRWTHPGMALFVIITPFLGQLLVFLIFPVLVLPYIEERFEVRLQQVLPPMAGKVLFYRYSQAIESVLEEFKRTHSPFVIFEAVVRTRSHAVNPASALGANRSSACALFSVASADAFMLRCAGAAA